MQIITKINQLQAQNYSEFGITIGNFDGVHLGHREIIEYIKTDCKKNNRGLIVVSFVPHPQIVINSKTNFLINNYEFRKEMMEGMGVDVFLEIQFNREISNLPPDDFLDKFIFSSPKIKKIFLGHDFAFGANKSGDHEFMKKYCAKNNIEFDILNEFKSKSGTISSSEIRELLLDGNVEKASTMLGRDFFLSGRIIKGAGRGKQIGFPTANIQLGEELIIPKKGVYSTLTKYKDGNYISVTNIGHNPTFTNENKLNVETHILDFKDDIYGEEIQVHFVDRIRNEKKFDSVNELIKQISDDVERRRGKRDA